MAEARRGARIHQLQSLRFFAAALVLFGHVLMEARQHGSAAAQGWWYDLPWGGGVDIFFVISGFIILFVGERLPRGGFAAADFMVKRVIRIVPLYWLFTFMMAAVLVLMPSRVEEGPLTATALVKSLLYIPFAQPGSGAVRPILGQGWTLHYEMFFYILFAGAIAVTTRRYLWTSVGLAALMLLGAVAPLPVPLAFVCTPFLMLFIVGMTLAHFHERLPAHGTGVTLLLFAAAIAWAGLFPHGADNDILFRMAQRGVPAIAMVYAILHWRTPPAWLTGGAVPVLGDASYALYLSHPFVVNACLILFAKLHLGIGLVFLVVASLTATSLSVGLFRFVEVPVLKLLTDQYRHSALGRRLAGARPDPTALVANVGAEA